MEPLAAARSRGQDEIFEASEGDRWFERNAAALGRLDPDNDRVIRVLDLYGIRPRRALEIGAANGFRLAAIAQRYGTVAVGIEPSAKAVLDGRSRFPGITLHQGLAHRLPIESEFDLVILNFVLHWVGRQRLLKVVAEIDRCIADDGYLAIGDFYPRNLVRNRYHHLPGEGVQTFKQDYAAIFVASGLYQQIGLMTGRYDSDAPMTGVLEHDRAALTLLQKKLTDLYVADPGV